MGFTQSLIDRGGRGMVILIDNYDSFVYNLGRYVNQLGFRTNVVRNDQISIDEIKKINPTHIILSPGPCAPDQAGISLSVIKSFANQMPILGVCLGHQTIGQAYGSYISKAKRPMHGKASVIEHDGSGLFADIPKLLRVGRYHSLIVNDKGLSSDIKVTARSEDGEIMAIAHKKKPVFGVQFHPESVMTEYGYKILHNFLKN